MSGVFGAALPASAQTALTEQEAHAIGVAAYLYFYPLVTMDVTRKQLTNIEPGKGFGGPMNTFANVPAYPTAADRAVVQAQLRHAVFQRMAGLDQGADDRVSARHRRPLLSPADARYVERRVCIARLAHDGHSGGKLPHHSTQLERRNSFGNDTHRRADALCVDYRADKNGRAAGLRCSSQDTSRLQNHATLTKLFAANSED